MQMGLTQRPRVLEAVLSFIVVIASIWIIDQFGNILTSQHSWYYWVGLLGLLGFVIFWNDIYYGIWDRLGWRIPAHKAQESARTRILRLFVHFSLLTVGFFLLDRSPRTILAPTNSVPYQIGLIVFSIAAALWPSAALMPVGQHALRSSAMEKLAIAWITVAILSVSSEVFLVSSFSQRYLFGKWSVWDKSYVQGYFDEARENNQYVQRDVTHNFEKPEGVMRILIVGDSLAYGVGVLYEDAFPALMQKMAGPQVEIITRAQVGANTADEIALVQEGCRFHPDMLIVAVYPNDIEVIEQSAYQLDGDPDLELYPPLSTQLQILTRLNSDHSYNPALFALADAAINQVLQRAPTNQFNLTSEQMDRAFKSWQRAADDLSQTARSCGIGQLYAVMLPTSQEQNKDYERMRQLYEDAGFASVDLMPAFKAEFGNLPVRALWAMPEDGHPNPELHRWYAEQIWPIIEPVVESE